jgi:hypothetical protein
MSNVDGIGEKHKGCCDRVNKANFSISNTTEFVWFAHPCFVYASSRNCTFVLIRKKQRIKTSLGF